MGEFVGIVTTIEADVSTSRRTTGRRVVPVLVDSPVNRSVNGIKSAPLDDLARARELYIDVLAELRRTRRLRYSDHRFSEADLATQSGVRLEELREFKLGLVEDPNVARIGEVLSGQVGDKDPRVIEIFEIARKGEELEPERKEKFLVEDSKTESSGKIIEKLIRMGNVRVRQAAINAGISERTLRGICLGTVEQPRYYILNQIVEALGYIPDGPISRLIRVKSRGRNLLSPEEADQADFPSIFEYSAIISGVSPEYLGEKVGKSRGWGKEIIKKNFLPSIEDLEILMGKLSLNFLERERLRQKLKDAREERDNEISRERKELVENLRSFLEEKGMTIKDLAGLLEIGGSAVSLWFSGKKLPAEYMTIRIRNLLANHNITS